MALHTKILVKSFQPNDLYNGPALARDVAMTTLTRLCALLAGLLIASSLTANAQELRAPAGVPIESFDVSGLPFRELSPGLRQQIE